ncbi:hypothetical protein J5X98_20420 [Leptothermofonsia sichuanensis E412]|uniref:hypothetical protein n=1 Tax=Leptothermofonsia sichuanensis TaxID=2917832 RepID=UPI001CA71567|nr:hypothetical protein [Leptothermofonsia sichuanensis]QZZ19674.1 hypothetical protein J5X98_20420 [Leptothermofonsia sichuanensis E412]
MNSDRESEPHKPVDGRFPLQKLQIITAILVSLFGIFTSWQSYQAATSAQHTSNRLQEIDQETRRVQEFARRIQDQLPNLTDKNSAKAKIALASLYSLAREESDKSILFTVAIVSDNEALRQTIADLILGDASASGGFKRDIEAKLQKRLTAQSREAATQDQTDKANRTETEVKLLQQLTAERPTISGWVYLGKVPTGTSTLADDRTIKATTLPNVGTTIEADTAINLRDIGGRQGNITGVIARNSKLTVQELKRRQLDSNFEAVWAKVTR